MELMRVRRRFLIIAGGFLLASLIMSETALNLLRWRMAQGERSAPQEVRKINEAIKTYITEHGTAPPTLSSLRGRIPSEWSCGAPTCDGLGYRFQYTVSAQDPGKPRYRVSAQPIQHGLTGVRSYYLDQTGILRCTGEARAATGDDPPLHDGLCSK